MDEAYTREYEKFELSHWWFLARRSIITSFMDRYASRSNAQARWLDVGCGTGVLLDAYKKFTDKMGVELHAESAAAARAKGLRVETSGQAWDFRSFGTFDLITLCDVIEHVEDDRNAVQTASLALKEGGLVLVTVPALMSLWSDHDVVNHHFRRYTRRQLLDLFPADRWEVLRASYFSSFLLPAIWLSRVLKRRSDGPASATGDLKFGPRWLDALLHSIFHSEQWILRWCNLWLGSSLILAARKRSCPGS